MAAGRTAGPSPGEILRLFEHNASQLGGRSALGVFPLGDGLRFDGNLAVPLLKRYNNVNRTIGRNVAYALSASGYLRVDCEIGELPLTRVALFGEAAARGAWLSVTLEQDDSAKHGELITTIHVPAYSNDFETRWGLLSRLGVNPIDLNSSTIVPREHMLEAPLQVVAALSGLTEGVITGRAGTGREPDHDDA